jgi:hypothetical protein
MIYYKIVFSHTIQLPSELVEDWTQFKDLVRLVVTGQPGWTDTWPLKKAGVFSVKTAQDAQMAFSMELDTKADLIQLLNGPGALTGNKVHRHKLLVHYFDVSTRGSAKLLKCNCIEFFNTDGHDEQRSFAMLQVEHWTNVQNTPTYGLVSPQQDPGLNMHPTPNQPFYTRFPITPGTVQPSSYYDNGTPGIGLPYSNPYAVTGYQYFEQMPPQPTLSASYPAYAMNNYELCVPVIQEAPPPENHKVIICGLRSNITEGELQRLLKSAGEHVQCELQRNGTSNHPKATADVYFATEGEARHAIRTINGRVYSAIKLRAWHPKPATPAEETPQGPMIVNGSTYQVSPSPNPVGYEDDYKHHRILGNGAYDLDAAVIPKLAHDAGSCHSRRWQQKDEKSPPIILFDGKPMVFVA